MKIIFPIAFVIAATAAMAAVPLDPRDGVIFPAARAKEFLNQCSRQAPRPVNGVWQPGQQQVRDLEARLPVALASAMAAAAKSAVNRDAYEDIKTQYLRQYSGLIIKSQKVIYVNASPADETFRGDGKARKGPWRVSPVMVCDGGPQFFGVEYDPVTKGFFNFAFNGFP